MAVADFQNRGIFEGILVEKRSGEKRNGKGVWRSIRIGQKIGVPGPEFPLPEEFKGAIPEEGTSVRVEYVLQTGSAVRTVAGGRQFAASESYPRVVNISPLPAK